MQPTFRSLKRHIASNGLYLSALQRLGFHIRIQFYYYEDEYVFLHDIILFDVVLNKTFKNILNPKNIIRIDKLNLQGGSSAITRMLSLSIMRKSSSEAFNFTCKRVASYSMKMRSQKIQLELA